MGRTHMLSGFKGIPAFHRPGRPSARSPAGRVPSTYQIPATGGPLLHPV